MTKFNTDEMVAKIEAFLNSDSNAMVQIRNGNQTKFLNSDDEYEVVADKGKVFVRENGIVRITITKDTMVNWDGFEVSEEEDDEVDFDDDGDALDVSEGDVVEITYKSQRSGNIKTVEGKVSDVYNGRGFEIENGRRTLSYRVNSGPTPSMLISETVKQYTRLSFKVTCEIVAFDSKRVPLFGVISEEDSYITPVREWDEAYEARDSLKADGHTNIRVLGYGKEGAPIVLEDETDWWSWERNPKGRRLR